MRKVNTILLIIICCVLSTNGHGKIAGKHAIAIPVIREIKPLQNIDTKHATTLFDDTLIPPILVFMVLPT